MNSYYRQKIWERLIKNHKIGKGNCYLWTGYVDLRGYGKTHIWDRNFYVHHLSVIFFRDIELDTKMIVRHKCKNRHCFNPEHLLIKFKDSF